MVSWRRFCRLWAGVRETRSVGHPHTGFARGLQSGSGFCDGAWRRHPGERGVLPTRRCCRGRRNPAVSGWEYPTSRVCPQNPVTKIGTKVSISTVRSQTNCGVCARLRCGKIGVRLGAAQVGAMRTGRWCESILLFDDVKSGAKRGMIRAAYRALDYGTGPGRFRGDAGVQPTVRHPIVAPRSCGHNLVTN